MADDSLYQALGVSRTASAEEIRKAYKKLARENHPDVKPDDADAAQRFKKATEAYNVLKDAEKREQYDRFGRGFPGAGGGGQRHPWTGAGGGQQVDLRDLFAETGFSFDDLFGGGGPFGGGGGGRRPRPQPRPAKGADQEIELDVDFRTAALGGIREVSFRRDGKLERIDVKVPAGVDAGSIVRLGGQGEPGRDGGPAGDLRLRIKVARHPWFQRDGRNLTVEVPVTPSEAALGAKVDVPTLDEGTIVLTLPPGTSSGAKLRVRGKGIADPKGGAPGDQFVVVKIVVPRELDEETRGLYEQLAEHSTDPRTGMWS